MLRMRSRCLDRIKSSRVKPARSLDAVSEAQTRVGPDAESAADGHSVRSAVALLSDVRCDVLMLEYFEGLSSSENAARLEDPRWYR
jgi:DNA-directed RNA polymerase specialized sigma24 family protein